MKKKKKKVEYALIALKLFAEKPNEVFTSKQISDKYNVPYELLSKVLQELKKCGLLSSSLGMNGGYKLDKDPDQITIQQVISAIDGGISLTECQQGKTKDNCIIFDNCSIKDPMHKIQNELQNFFNKKKVSDLV